MGISGKFKLESSSNIPAAFAALGFPESDIKTFLDPKNEIVYNVQDNGDGSFEVASTLSLMPTWNTQNSMKIGETKEFTTPFPYKICVNKNSNNNYVQRMEMNGKVLNTEQVYNNYGMTVTGTIEGTNITFKEYYKRITPRISGYYVFESETNLAGLMKAVGLDNMDVSQMTNGMAFRIVEKGDCAEITEYFGGDKKTYCVKYDQEFDYERPDWNVYEKRINTMIGPDSMKTVCRNIKTGKIMEYTSTFSDRGVTFNSKAGGAESTEFYKRSADMEGNWKAVSCTGAEAFADALGMVGDVKKGYIETRTTEKYSLERLPGGLVEIKSDSPWLPGGVMVIKPGEEYTVEIPGMGKATGIGYEGCDVYTQATKMMGKTISYTDKFSGNFCIQEAVVDGCKSSTQVAILIRE